MLIDDIKPYERNARHNEKAVPVVAESIREFGLKGQIVLESRDNPVIVAGHTRWAACKSLGWTEIPDERIDYCDDLTEDQIKAYRLADNRTGEVATWNRALVKSEVRALDKSSIDMSRFKFDFKSKGKLYGQERLRTDDYYNLGVVSKADCGGKYDMPTVQRPSGIPNKLLGFNYAKTAKDTDAWIHFFVDDYQFERVWNKPSEYVDLLKRFNGVLSPDFSLYMDMPVPMQQWNEYRRRALMQYWQRNGIDVIPTLSWTTEESYGFCFDGLPKYSTVAVSTVGVLNSAYASDVWVRGMDRAMRDLKPRVVVLYGGDIGYDFGDTEVVRFKSNTAFTG